MKSLDSCPVCLSPRIRHIKSGTYKFIFKSGTYTLNKISFDKCMDCREAVFGNDVVDKLEALKKRMKKPTRIR